MATFQDQGGMAAMDPSALVRWATSKALRYLVGERREQRRRAKFERARRRAGAPHLVEYFHQIDDGYSHLAAQLLQPLLNAYDIELACHLVPPPSGPNAPEPTLLANLSRYDAAKIAPHYGLEFPGRDAPDAELVAMATRLLANAHGAEFAALAPQVGDAVWRGSNEALADLAQLRAPVSAAAAADAETAGSKRRERLGHYSSAMFYYAGEWYWGVDRLYHLERRLADLGARRTTSKDGELLAPRPPVLHGPLRDNGSLTLEIYASVRSPYTSVDFDAAVRLARETGVTLAVRPVLPMVMRNVPVTRRKGIYIFTDAAREARAQGLAWGNLVDPIGEPVRRCYSLYPWAESQGHGVALLSAFMRTAFFEGVNTNSGRGLRRVVEDAGLDWGEAETHLGSTEWEALIEVNRQAMYRLGLWGVPSFHLRDAAGETALAVWGQDRLWLVSREIQRLLGEGKAAS